MNFQELEQALMAYPSDGHLGEIPARAATQLAPGSSIEFRDRYDLPEVWLRIYESRAKMASESNLPLPVGLNETIRSFRCASSGLAGGFVEADDGQVQFYFWLDQIHWLRGCILLDTHMPWWVAR